jgi:arylsulfatase A-like enzyme
VDIRPTLLDLAGVLQSGDEVVDGHSLVPILRGDEPTGRATERPIVLQWDSGQEPRHGRAYCVIEDRWKLVQPCGMDAPNQQHIRDRYAELCRLQGRGDRSIEGPPRYELYDIQADPGEHHDLSEEHPDEVARLRSLYDAWFADVAGDAAGRK